MSHSDREDEAGSSGLTTRCSPSYFLKRLKEIGLKEKHVEAVRNTPFGHFLNLQDGQVEATLVTTLARHYNPARKAFLIGREYKIFSVEEVSDIMGLSLRGDEVDLSQSYSGSDIVAKYFNNKFPVRKDIVEKLKILVKANKDITGITKLVVLLIFVCILFPQTNYYLPQNLYKYIDNIEGLKKYAWGTIVYNYVVDQLVKKKEDLRGYFGGCALAVTVWYYETMFGIIPTCESQLAYKDATPRVLKWGTKSYKCVGAYDKMHQELCLQQDDHEETEIREEAEGGAFHPIEVSGPTYQQLWNEITQLEDKHGQLERKIELLEHKYNEKNENNAALRSKIESLERKYDEVHHIVEILRQKRTRKCFEENQPNDGDHDEERLFKRIRKRELEKRLVKKEIEDDI